MKGYIHSIEKRRLFIMVIGNVFLGMGISIFKLSGMGNDPFSGMVMALAENIGMTYANFLILLNLVLFVIEFITGRKFIGAGTFVNAILLGYIATFFHSSWLSLFGEPQLLWQRVVIVAIGVVVCSFGVSLYQTSDVGVAPYDSLSLIMRDNFPKVSYFWHRMFTDALCALICFLAGGIIGLGTLVSAFGLGPIIHFFDVNFTEKLLTKRPPNQTNLENL
ncbi:hypothetical protein KIH86_20195 [Paenibacillus sp. HN-1]|nr:hypothetical protein [Paenibacillus sp. CGMCC 1.18879]MBY9080715.1 hypothetical protein [Paenibacillus sp. CGMCC 1.18879]MBY9086529.1 hypothetical protein [Paenibacillus sinensis]